MTQSLLNNIYVDLTVRPEGIDAALKSLSLHLRKLKRELSTTQWQNTISICRDHQLRDLLHQDPLTARAFAMSRGYQGDAELLDIIYAGDYRPFCSAPVTPLGEAIFQHTIQCQAPSAVRERRKFLAAQIDAYCTEFPAAKILSVACGHLRELELSIAIQSRSFGRFVGLDQDAATLETVEKKWGHLGVEVQRATVKAFLSKSSLPEQFDFIYVAGLYDYLDDSLAQHITHRLFDMLHPGGRLLIGNYTPDTDDAGYMEVYMNWSLIYRDAQAMRRLAKTIPMSNVAGVSTLLDTTGAVIYLDIKAK